MTDTRTTQFPQSADELAPHTRLTADLEGDPNKAALTARGRYIAHQRAERLARDARATVEAARDAVAEADARQREAVREVLATGTLSLVEVAEVLGVSRVRVYQICDGRR